MGFCANVTREPRCRTSIHRDGSARGGALRREWTADDSQSSKTLENLLVPGESRASCGS